MARLAARIRGRRRGPAKSSSGHGVLRVVVSDTEQASAEALPLVVAAGVRLARFERVRPTLEDVFLQLVGDGPGAVAQEESNAWSAARPPA